MQQLLPQNLANLVYGYAVMGVDPGPMLLIAIAKEAQRQLHDFGPQVPKSSDTPQHTVQLLPGSHTSRALSKRHVSTATTECPSLLSLKAQPNAKQGMQDEQWLGRSDDWCSHSDT